MLKMMDLVILAGGLGTRLRSVVSEVPKCMAPVAGRPFLWYLLEQLRHYAVRRVILSVGYLREVIQDWIAAHADEYPFEFVFAVEEEPLGTGGGIRLAVSMAESSDVVKRMAFTNVLSQSNTTHKSVPMLLSAVGAEDFDSIYHQRGIITAFREKAPCAEGLINGGIYALDAGSGVLEGHGPRFSFEKDVLEPQCAAGTLSGVVQDGFFIDIGIPDDYASACAQPWLLQKPVSFPEAVRSLQGVDTLLLDRDGVINRMLPGDYVKTFDEFEWLQGAKEALADAARKFPRIYIVSNQRGVGRGVMTREALDDVHRRMLADISNAGGRIDGIYVCTAVSEEDPFRKPHRGMFDAILKEHPEVLPERTAMIGDSPSDMEFARNCGIRGIWCRSEK